MRTRSLGFLGLGRSTAGLGGTAGLAAVGVAALLMAPGLLASNDATGDEAPAPPHVLRIGDRFEYRSPGGDSRLDVALRVVAVTEVQDLTGHDRTVAVIARDSRDHTSLHLLTLDGRRYADVDCQPISQIDDDCPALTLRLKDDGAAVPLLLGHALWTSTPGEGEAVLPAHVRSGPSSVTFTVAPRDDGCRTYTPQGDAARILTTTSLSLAARFTLCPGSAMPVEMETASVKGTWTGPLLRLVAHAPGDGAEVPLALPGPALEFPTLTDDRARVSVLPPRGAGPVGEPDMHESFNWAKQLDERVRAFLATHPDAVAHTVRGHQAWDYVSAADVPVFGQGSVTFTLADPASGKALRVATIWPRVAGLMPIPEVYTEEIRVEPWDASAMPPMQMPLHAGADALAAVIDTRPIEAVSVLNWDSLFAGPHGLNAQGYVYIYHLDGVPHPPSNMWIPGISVDATTAQPVYASIPAEQARDLVPEHLWPRGG